MLFSFRVKLYKGKTEDEVNMLIKASLKLKNKREYTEDAFNISAIPSFLF